MIAITSFACDRCHWDTHVGEEANVQVRSI